MTTDSKLNEMTDNSLRIPDKYYVELAIDSLSKAESNMVKTLMHLANANIEYGYISQVEKSSLKPIRKQITILIKLLVEWESR